MSVSQRGPHWYYEFMWQGQKIRRACGRGCKTKTRAKQIEADARAKVMSGNMPRRGKAPVLSVAAKEFLAETEEAFKSGAIAWNTFRHYRNAWDAWLSGLDIAAMRVDQITAGMIRNLEIPGGPFTRKNALQALGSILKWCATEGHIKAAPHIRSTRVQGRKIRLTSDQQGLLLAHMDRDCADIFTIMLDAMMRPSEVMAMRWEDVHWERNEYYVPHGKTEAAKRNVPISDRMAALLKARQAGSKSEWVFPSRKLGKGHRVTIAKQFEAARQAAGLDSKVKLYSARHTGASELSEMGVDLLTMRTLLGHEDISTTNKYLHGDTTGLADKVNQRNNRRKLQLVKGA